MSVPKQLPSLVRAAFNQAKAAGDLVFYPTQVTLVRANSTPFQLRFSPALASKPKPAAPPPASHSTSKPFDPFADPPRALYVCPVGAQHFLVLNKFAVVPEHFILATTDFKAQTDLLEEDDLAAARACIDAYAEAGPEDGGGGGELFVFFNSGESSGASQPHRHLQLLPVESMRDGMSDGGDQWEVLADRDVKNLPFVVLREDIPENMSSGELHRLYIGLYNDACQLMATVNGSRPYDGLQTSGESAFSYNLAMTSKSLALCPRLRDGADLKRGDELVGKVSLNGTVLAGTALVKDEKEWQALRDDETLLAKVLGEIGVPNGASGKL